MASGMTTYMCVWYLGIVCCIPQVRAGDVYVILIIENRRCNPQMGVGNAYIQYSLITSSYRL
ncbi:hypothetical protein IMCC21906_00209 [Spongiibacter sp. IMCC21906]|nr:hypothetical protein IMCC21906_00209 [Spongiibacter sp. IMCC21906]